MNASRYRFGTNLLQKPTRTPRPELRKEPLLRSLQKVLVQCRRPRLDHAPVCTLSDHRSLRATIDASRPPNSHAYRPSDEVSEPKECCNTDAASARDGGSFEVSCSVKTTYCSLAAIMRIYEAMRKAITVFMAAREALKAVFELRLDSYPRNSYA